MVVARIEPDADVVRRRKVVAPPHPGGDRLRRGILTGHSDAEIAVVIRELQPRGFRRGLAIVRIALNETARRLRGRPYLVVQAAVDGRRRPPDAEGADNFALLEGAAGLVGRVDRGVGLRSGGGAGGLSPGRDGA